MAYEKGSGDNLISIEVKITDMAGIPFSQMGASMMGLMEFENETVNGYEKSIQVQGFKGTEKVNRSENNKTAEMHLAVGNRFLFISKTTKIILNSFHIILAQIISSLHLNKNNRAFSSLNPMKRHGRNINSHTGKKEIFLTINGHQGLSF